MSTFEDDEEIDEWASGARTLLVTTARRVAIRPPELVLEDPGALFPVFDQLLSSVPLTDLTEDEFYMLFTQLVSLIAQVLMIEHGAIWILDEDPRSISNENYVLSRKSSSEETPYKVDPFLLVKAELASEHPDFERLVKRARTLICWNQPDIPDLIEEP